VSYWACAQVAPQQERSAQDFLRLRGFESYCPRLRVTRRQHGRKIELRPPLFVSYVFVWIVAGRWWDARWCPRVSRIILNGTVPAVVPDCIVDELRSREVRGAIDLPRHEEFKPGDLLRVITGPFRDQIAELVSLRPRQRVEVLLGILGAQQKVVLAQDAVEAIRSD